MPLVDQELPLRKLGRPFGVSDTRERVLEKASHLFAAQGFEGTTLREISSALGVSGPALLHHFGTKKRLYAEVLAGISASIEPFLPSASENGTREGVLRVVDGFFEWTCRNTHLAKLLMRELMENRERVDRARQLSMKPVMSAYIEYIQRGQKAGTLPRFDAEMFAFSFTGAIPHFVAASPTARRILDVDSEAKLLTRFRAELLASVGAMLDGYSRK